MLVGVCAADADEACLERFELLLGAEFVGHCGWMVCIGTMMVKEGNVDVKVEEVAMCNARPGSLSGVRQSPRA